MPRLIDWDKVLEWMHRQKETTEQWSMRIAIENYVDDMPEAVVRCKDCKYASMTYDGECKYCQRWKEKYDGESVSLYLDGDFYCAFGERREDAKTN